MEIKQIKTKQYLLLAIGITILFIGILISDNLSNKQKQATTFQLNSVGEGESQLELNLSAGDVLSDYTYALTLSEEKLNETDAMQILMQAEEEIDSTIFGEESPDFVAGDLIIANRYVNNTVKAEWTFFPYGFYEDDGTRTDEKLPEEGLLITVQADLNCQGYRESYSFSFMAYPKEQTEAESLISSIDAYIEDQIEEGESNITLPSEINGIKLDWSNKKQKNAWKVIPFGAVIAVLLFLSTKEKEKKAFIEKKKQLELDYPEIVSQISILLGSGMTIKHSWNKISARYIANRQNRRCMERPGFEALCRATRKMSEGESMEKAITLFGTEAENVMYYRLSRILLRNLKKGSHGIASLLDQESKSAFEERKRMAKKQGEEAGTKMLLPLVMMLCIVLIIVIAPAIMSFHA